MIPNYVGAIDGISSSALTLAVNWGLREPRLFQLLYNEGDGHDSHSHH
jgi:hypothetical protein